MAGMLSALARFGAGTMAGARAVSMVAVRNRASAMFGAGQSVGGLGRWAVGRELSAAGSSWSQVSNRLYGYLANSRMRNTLPDPDEILKAWHRGDVDPDSFDWSLAFHGIPGAQNAPPGASSIVPVWKSIIDNSRPDLDLATYEKLWRMESVHPLGVTDQVFRDRLRRHGLYGDRAEILLGGVAGERNIPTEPYGLDHLYYLRDTGQIDFDGWRKWLRAMGITSEQQQKSLWEVKALLDPQTVYQLYRWGIIGGIDEAKMYWKMSGIQEPEATLLWEGLREAPTVPDILQLWNRGKLGDVEAKKYLLANGYRERENDLMAELRKEIPGPSDIVRFALREVWDPAIVRKWGYDQEFPATFQHWMKQLGYDWTENVAGPGGVIQGVPWPMAYWSSHWDIFAPGQSAEILQRVRPDNIDRWRRLTGNPNLQPYTWQNHLDVLKIKDYPPGDGQTTFPRDWLSCISYRIIDKRDINWASKFLGWKAPEMIQAYQDQGFTADDATTLANIALERRKHEDEAPHRARVKQLQNEDVKYLRKAYALGQITADQVRIKLMMYSWKEEAIEGTINNVNEALHIKCMADFQTNVRRRLLAGEISVDEAFNELLARGVFRDRATQIVGCWASLLTPKRKMLTAGEILTALGSCLITPDEARTRLVNMGYNDPDSMILVTQARNKCDSLVAKKNKVLEQARVKQAAELQRLIKEQEKHLKDMQTRVRQLTPWGKLKSWFVTGRIGEDYMRERLAAMGFDEETIQLYVWEAQEAQRLEQEKTGQVSKNGKPEPEIVVGDIGQSGPSG